MPMSIVAFSTTSIRVEYAPKFGDPSNSIERSHDVSPESVNVPSLAVVVDVVDTRSSTVAP